MVLWFANEKAKATMELVNEQLSQADAISQWATFSKRQTSRVQSILGLQHKRLYVRTLCPVACIDPQIKSLSDAVSLRPYKYKQFIYPAGCKKYSHHWQSRFISRRSVHMIMFLTNRFWQPGLPGAFLTEKCQTLFVKRKIFKFYYINFYRLLKRPTLINSQQFRGQPI